MDNDSGNLNAYSDKGGGSNVPQMVLSSGDMEKMKPTVPAMLSASAPPEKIKHMGDGVTPAAVTPPARAAPRAGVVSPPGKGPAVYEMLKHADKKDKRGGASVEEALRISLKKGNFKSKPSTDPEQTPQHESHSAPSSPSRKNEPALKDFLFKSHGESGSTMDMKNFLKTPMRAGGRPMERILNPNVQNLVGVLDLEASERQRQNRLESINATIKFSIDMMQLVTFIVFVVFEAAVTGMTRNRWPQAGCSLENGCNVTSFTVTEYVNFVGISFCCFVMLVAWIIGLRQAWIGYYKDHVYRGDFLWTLVFLLPVDILWNNPALNLDRVQFTSSHISADATRGLIIFRYVMSAVTTSSFSTYFALKLGSISRGESLDDPYSWSFYAWRVVPNLVVFAAQVTCQIIARVEFSPQLFVSWITLTRADSNDKTVIVANVFGALNVLIVVAYMANYYYSSRKNSQIPYMRVRQKHLQAFWTFRGIFVYVSALTITTLVCSPLVPQGMVLVGSDPIVANEVKTAEVLNMPYYGRFGIKLAYTLFSLLEMYLSMPSRYKPSWLEKQVLTLVGGDEDMHNSFVGSESFRDLGGLARDSNMSRESTGVLFQSVSVPLKWEATRDPNTGMRMNPVSKFVMSENVICFDLSWLVYLDDPVIHAVFEHDLSEKGWKLHRLVRTGLENHDLVYAIAYNNESVIVAFRGTVTSANWKVNAQVLQVDHTPVVGPEWLESKWKRPQLGQKKPRVHRGFARAYDAMRADVQLLVTELFGSEGRFMTKHPRLFVTGHSLGGALATLCAFDLALHLELPKNRISLYTYGSPKVGNRAFARRFSVLVPHSWRVVNKDDFITNNPKDTWEHYEHVPRAVLVDEGGNLIIDPVFADMTLFHGSHALPHLMGSYREHMVKFVEASGSGYNAQWVEFNAFDPNDIAEQNMLKAALQTEVSMQLKKATRKQTNLTKLLNELDVSQSDLQSPMVNSSAILNPSEKVFSPSSISKVTENEPDGDAAGEHEDPSSFLHNIV
ncbi:Lipase [Porphyridium purpureum]|uniref:Lipase n=1 Tax=Porphyridium purpureum TaxID=35688 RepID=A0A5J4YUL1_PORPP|nr:Lipase [Porphyridium purpureum]|eukprot:POR7171..scf227_4